MKYGQEILVDIHDCNGGPFSRVFIADFMVRLCDLIDMEREDLHFWDYDEDPEGYADAPDHLKGISAVQFIKTSNVVVHTIDAHNKVFLNVFSCKDFNPATVATFAAEAFGGIVRKAVTVNRI
jgi:S-adenosylmethionine/arginine decarboxylase-like enzyme